MTSPMAKSETVLKLLQQKLKAFDSGALNSDDFSRQIASVLARENSFVIVEVVVSLLLGKGE